MRGESALLDGALSLRQRATRARCGNQNVGDGGERSMCEHVAYPNCGKALLLLPPNYPMLGIEYTACDSRAQVKTSRS